MSYRKPFIAFATAYPQRIAARRPPGSTGRSLARIAQEQIHPRTMRQVAAQQAQAGMIARRWHPLMAQQMARRSAPILMQRIPELVKRVMAPGGTYLGEDASYYYYMEPGATDGLGGLFDKIGDVFKKIPKAFAPKNLYKTFIDTTLTVASGGLYLAAPKKLRGQIRNVANYAVPAIAGGVLAYTAGPAVMSALMPKLKMAGSLLSSGASKVGSFIQSGASSIFGGGKGGGGGDTTESDWTSQVGRTTRTGYQEGGQVDLNSIGGAVIGLLNRLPQHKQAEVIERLTPEDIAYMERYNQIPPHLQGYFNSLNQQPGVIPEGTGAASLYPGAMAPGEAPVEAGMFGGMSGNTLLLIGVPAAFFLLTQLGGNGSKKK